MLPLLLSLLLFPNEGSLEAKLMPFIEAHEGKVAVAVRELGEEEPFLHHADAVMPTASLIKLPILLEAYLQVAEGKHKLTDTITLREKDKVPGSGILTHHFSGGTTFPFKDALHLMTAVSDNTATNLVLDRIGMKEVNDRMAKWGLKETRVNAKVFRGSTTSLDPERTKKYGLGSTTAREMLRLLEILERGEHGLKPGLKQAILGHLKKTDDKRKFLRYLKKDIILAHKTGTVSDARTSAGILYFDGRAVFLVVLTAENKDKSWGDTNAGEILCGKIAEAVVEHYRNPKNK